VTLPPEIDAVLLGAIITLQAFIIREVNALTVRIAVLEQQIKDEQKRK